MAARLARVMQFQLKAAVESDNPYLIPLVDEGNVKVWHFLVVNLPGVYAGGEYIFRLTAPDDFPQKPPELVAMTPNGVMLMDGKICLSIGEFHANDAPGKTGAGGWRPALGMVGMAREVANALLVPDSLGGGIRIEIKTPAERAALARRSADYNAQRHPALMARFAAFQRDNPDVRAVRILRTRKAAQLALKCLPVGPDDFEAQAARLAAAFDDAETQAWPFLATSLGYLGSVPDLPTDQLAAMGFPASGRAVLARVGQQVRDALAEDEAPVRRVLCLALHARLCREILGELGRPDDEWQRRYDDGYAAFLRDLPDVCGGAARVSVPAAFGRLPAASFAELHARLSTFLRIQDIDRKAKEGAALAALAAAAAALAPAPPAAPAARAPSRPAAAPTVEVAARAPAPPAAALDEYIDDLLDEL